MSQVMAMGRTAMPFSLAARASSADTRLMTFQKKPRRGQSPAWRQQGSDAADAAVAAL